MPKVNIGNEWLETMKLAFKNKELFLIYRQSLPLLTRIIKNYVKREKVNQIAIADFGGADGQITDFLKKELAHSVQLHITAIDTDGELLKRNASADRTYTKRLTMPLGTNKCDIGIMRYVLNYNTKTDQFLILKNVFRAMKKDGIFVHQWCGVYDKGQQKKFQKLFKDKKMIEGKMFRKDCYWPTWEETDAMLRKVGLHVAIHKQYKLPIKELYKIRYDLTDIENDAILKFLGKDAYIYYTIFEATK